MELEELRAKLRAWKERQKLQQEIGEDQNLQSQSQPYEGSEQKEAAESLQQQAIETSTSEDHIQRQSYPEEHPSQQAYSYEASQMEETGYEESLQDFGEFESVSNPTIEQPVEAGQEYSGSEAQYNQNQDHISQWDEKLAHQGEEEVIPVEEFDEILEDSSEEDINKN